MANSNKMRSYWERERDEQAKSPKEDQNALDSFLDIIRRDQPLSSTIGAVIGVAIGAFFKLLFDIKNKFTKKKEQQHLSESAAPTRRKSATTQIKPELLRTLSTTTKAETTIDAKQQPDAIKTNIEEEKTVDLTSKKEILSAMSNVPEKMKARKSSSISTSNLLHTSGRMSTETSRKKVSTISNSERHSSKKTKRKSNRISR